VSRLLPLLILVNILAVDVIYPNGISCSMPEELQEPMMRTIPGLENVKIVRPAYGVEYDHVDARELGRALSYQIPMQRLSYMILQRRWRLSVFKCVEFTILNLNGTDSGSGFIPGWSN
jgi:hypothetical protein